MATDIQGYGDHILEKAKAVPALGRRRRTEGKSKKTFPCQECQKYFNSVEKLKVHSYSHTGERPYCCSHPDCNKAFVSKYKLLRHMATHSPEKNYKCSYCEKMFHRKDHLKNHLHTHNPYKEAFNCQECGKSYNTKLGFKRHLAIHAANSGDLTCQVCLQPFPSTVVLLEHLKVHAGKSSSGTKEKKHHCEHCERRFYTRKDVRRHMVVHTGRKDFLCQYCAQRFGRKDHLTRHVKKSHYGELMKVKTEPADLLEPLVYDLASGSIKAELPATLMSRSHQLDVCTSHILETEPCSTPTHPFSLKYPLASNFTSHTFSSQDREATLTGELEIYLNELQSSMPSSLAAPQEPPHPSSKLQLDPQVGVVEKKSQEASLSRISTSEAEGAQSSSLMDFSQLFSFLPPSGPQYNQAGGPGDPTVGYQPPGENPPLIQLPFNAPEGPGVPSSPTILPRFHHAFQ